MPVTSPITSRIKVLTVDDHPFLRAGIVAVIDEEQDMVVVAEASNGYEAIDIYRAHTPDVTLMDLQLPDLSGIQALIAIRKEFPNARIIVLTTFEDGALAYRALKAGAAGYLLKSGIRKELTDAIRIVHTGQKHIPVEIATDLAVHMHHEDLTVREIEVLKAAANGRSNKMIASELFISEETVKVHMKNILHKLNASDRTHAFSLATIRGFFM
ncbi:response regulator [Acidicapsa ligni]|uniref:response regulator n=1 Tax=Acidicapsa ligni TaxID=542300 RepID=UPI0021E0C1AD|nr:response regulator transcription factor [Acidicapsa ligni]